MRLTKPIVVLGLIGLVTAAHAQPPGRGPGRSRGGMGRGRDASLAHDQSVFHELLRRHEDIERTVHQLPNGVRTRTTSSNSDLVAKIRDHVAAMEGRVKQGRPVRRWDPLFAELFAKHKEIEMAVTEIEGGVEVTETSKNPEVVRLIQAHARVVSGFVAEGFDEARRAHELPAAAGDATPKLTQATKSFLTNVSAKFDRLYIPALALTNQGETEPARKAIERLQAQLPGLEDQLRTNAQAGGDLLRGVAGIVRAASELVASGELQEAHETLEPLRELLAERRREAGVSYPLDVLSDYHAVMEAIVKPAKAAGPDRGDAVLMARIAELAVEASRIWAVAEQTKFTLPEGVNGWPSPDAVAKSVAAVRASITQLNDAVRDGDSQAITRRATGLKPPFAKLYMSFGDFAGLKSAGGAVSSQPANDRRSLPKEAPSRTRADN